MRLFSIRDSAKKYPLNLEPKDFAPSLFFKFCVRYFNLSLPNAASLEKLPQVEKTIEAVLPLLSEAKKEISLLPQNLSFFPTWPLFSIVNQWLNKLFRVQKNELLQSLTVKIKEATLKSPHTLQRDDAADQKLAQCMEHHRKEISTQAQAQQSQTYQQVKTEMKQVEAELHRLRKHREWVIEREGPKGTPCFHSVGGEIYLNYCPPSIKEQLDFEKTRLAHVDSEIERTKRNISQISIKHSMFFLPAKYNNYEEYKEQLEQRTQAALAPVNLCRQGL